MELLALMKALEEVCKKKGEGKHGILLYVEVDGDRMEQ